MSDAESAQARQRERWDAGAAGWVRSREAMQRFGAPVTEWMLEQAHLGPGQHVLELAAGAGETGFLAARRIAPGGRLTSSDASAAMVEGARARGDELGLEDVEYRVLALEWIDSAAASYDAVLCRWGLMFPIDTEAALREIRRVLKVGGRLAAATWAAARENPWSMVVRHALHDQGHVADAVEPGPGPFALPDPDALSELARAAGFTEVEVVAIAVEAEHASFEDYWALQSDLSASLREVLSRVEERSVEALKEAVEANLAPYTDDVGALRIPGRALGLAASA